jgi:hypothetical protein
MGARRQVIPLDDLPPAQAGHDTAGGQDENEQQEEEAAARICSTEDHG